MSDVIRPCIDHDFEAILEVINDAAHAYKGVIPHDRYKDPYMPAEELADEIEHGSGSGAWSRMDGCLA